MKIESSRFGTMDIEDGDEIAFPEGLVGFFDEQSFVLVRHRPDSPIGWLQSTKTAGLALPVVSVESLAYEYPLEMIDVPEFSAATHSVMVVLQARGITGPTVNMMAPIVVNTKTRTGFQVITPLGSQTPFVLQRDPQAQVSTAPASVHDIQSAQQQQQQEEEPAVFAKSA